MQKKGFLVLIIVIFAIIAIAAGSFGLSYAVYMNSDDSSHVEPGPGPEPEPQPTPPGPEPEPGPTPPEPGPEPPGPQPTSQYTITAVDSLDASKTVVETYDEGASVTISAKSHYGYSFNGWYDGTQLITYDNDYTFTVPDHDVSYTAKFISFAFTEVSGGYSIAATSYTPEIAVIPSTYKGQPVIAIAASGFDAIKANLSSVTIPESVTTIGAQAFDGCVLLESIFIPKSIKTISAAAFHGCTSLTNVEFDVDSQLSQIYNMVFQGCTNLVEIELPSSVISIGENSFKGCTKLETVTTQGTFRTLKEYAFDGCSAFIALVWKNSRDDFDTLVTVEFFAFNDVPSTAKVSCVPAPGSGGMGGDISINDINYK